MMQAINAYFFKSRCENIYETSSASVAEASQRRRLNGLHRKYGWIDYATLGGIAQQICAHWLGRLVHIQCWHICFKSERKKNASGIKGRWHSPDLLKKKCSTFLKAGAAHR
jgi:hypothetical protein